MRNYISKELEKIYKNPQIDKTCIPECLFFEDIMEYKKINNAASVDDLYNDLIYDRKVKSDNIIIAHYDDIKSIPIKSIDNINNFVEGLLVAEYENFIKDKFNLRIETYIKLPDDEKFIREFIEDTYDILDCSLNINSLFEQIIVPIYPSIDRDLLDKLFNITRSAILLGFDNSYKINSRLTTIPSISIDEKLKEFDVSEEKLYFRNSIRFTETHKLESSYCLLQKQNYSLDSLCVYSKSINSVRNIEDKRLILKVGDEVIFNIKGFITNNSAYSILKVYINSLDSIKNVNLRCFNYKPSNQSGPNGGIPTKFYFNKLEISKDFNPASVSIDTSLTIGSKEGEVVDITYGFEGVEIPELRFRKNVAFKSDCVFKSSTIGNCIDLNKTKFCNNTVNARAFKDAVINRISTSDNSTNFLSESIEQINKEAFYRLSVKENPSNLKINLENLKKIFFNAFLINGIEFEKNQNLKSLAYLEEGSICKGKFDCISFNGNSRLKSLRLNSFPGCTIGTLDLRGSRIERLEGSGVLDIKIDNLYIDGNITKCVNLEAGNVGINNLYISGGETFSIKNCEIVGDLVVPESIKNFSIENCKVSKVIFDKKIKLKSLTLIFEDQPKSAKDLINFDKVINNLAFGDMFKNGRKVYLFLNGIEDIEYSTFYKIYEYLFYYSSIYGNSPFINLSIINKKDEALTNSNRFNASYNFNCIKKYCIIKDGIRKLNIVNPKHLIFDDDLRLFPSVEEVSIQMNKKKSELFVNLFQAENVKKLTVGCKLTSPQICSNTKNTSLEEINLAYESNLSETVFYPAAFRRDLKVNVDVDGTGYYCDINMIELIINDLQDSIPEEANTNVNVEEIFLLACPKDIIVVFDNLRISSYSTYYEYINKLLDTFSVSISKKLINLFIDSKYKAEFISNLEEKGNYTVD